MTHERTREILATVLRAVIQRGLTYPATRQAMVERFGEVSVAQHEQDVITVAKIEQLIAELDRSSRVEG